MKNTSIGYYQSAYIEYVLAIGMLLSGMNFNLFYALLLRNFKQVLHNEELKFYLSRSEEHTSELQSRQYLVCRLLLEKKKQTIFRNSDITTYSSMILYD